MDCYPIIIKSLKSLPLPYIYTRASLKQYWIKVYKLTSYIIPITISVTKLNNGYLQKSYAPNTFWFWFFVQWTKIHKQAIQISNTRCCIRETKSRQSTWWALASYQRATVLFLIFSLWHFFETGNSMIN